MGICIKEALKLIKKNIKQVSFQIVPIENSNGSVKIIPIN